MKEFEELVDEHYKPLYRFAYSLIKEVDSASDLVQHTFYVWAEKGHQLKDRSKAKTWLFTTLYREYLNIARKRKRFVQEDTSQLDYLLPAEENGSERTLDAQRAVEVLGELDEMFRAPLSLFYLKQHSYKDIANILEIPIGTVMSRISRGKVLLKKSFFQHEQHPDNKIIPLKIKKNHG